MIIVILVRLSVNAMDRIIVKELNFNFTYFYMIAQITAELIPSSIMCVSFYVMAKEKEEPKDTLRESCIDE